MLSPEEIEDEKVVVQDEQEKKHGDGVGGGDPPPPKVASNTKSHALRKLEDDKAILRGFLIPFPLHRCGWSPEGGTKRWCILNLVLVIIAIIISLANLVLVSSKSHYPEKHKAFMAFHPGYYWKCKRVLLTIDVTCTFVGEVVYLIACTFLLVSVLFKETNMKILLANFYIYISFIFPLGYLPRMFLLSNAPCKDPSVWIDFGLIVVIFTLYILLWMWLLVGNRLVLSYILWLRNPDAEEFYRDNDSEIVDLEEGNEPKQYRRLSNNVKKTRNVFEVIIERKIARKPKPPPVLQSSSKSSKATVTIVPLKMKQSSTSMMEDDIVSTSKVPSTAPKTRPLNSKDEEKDDKKKKVGFFGRITGGLKNITKKK